MGGWGSTLIEAKGREERADEMGEVLCWGNHKGEKRERERERERHRERERERTKGKYSFCLGFSLVYSGLVWSGLVCFCLTT